ncbi:EMRE protein, partial [Erpornis zantholeuca]|nr:EMRE protein [Erpornis zantholeuca]
GLRATEPTLPPVAGTGKGRGKGSWKGRSPAPECDLLGCKDSPFAIDSLQTPFGLLRVFSVVIPFLYVGTQISKNFAALLEEHDIFVPEDDDDDD